MDTVKVRATGIFLYSFGALIYEIALIMLLPLLTGFLFFDRAASLLAVACFFIGSGIGAVIGARLGDRYLGTAVYAQLLCVLLLPLLVPFFSSNIPDISCLFSSECMGSWVTQVSGDARISNAIWGEALPSTPGPFSREYYGMEWVLVLVAFPFISVGYVISRVLGRALNDGGLASMYAWDLAGACLGAALCGYLMIPQLGMELTLLVSLTASLAGATILDIVRPRPLPALICLVLAANLVHIGIEPGVSQGCLDEGDELLFRGWSPLQRISLIRSQNAHWFCFNGVRYSLVARADPGNKTLTELGRLVFQGLRPRTVLVVGPGGGYKDVYQATLAHESDPAVAAAVTAVEVEPLMVSTLTGTYSHVNDGLYLSDGVNVINDDGRAFLQRPGDTYDLVLFSKVTDLATFRSYVLSENRMFSIEGIRHTLSRLSPDGTVVVVLTSRHEAQARRLIATGRELGGELFPDGRWQDHVRLLRLPGGDTLGDDLVIAISLSPSALGVLDGVSVPEAEMVAWTADIRPLSMDQPFAYNDPVDNIPSGLQKLAAGAGAIILLFLVTAGRLLAPLVKRRGRALRALLVFLIMGCWSMTFQGLYLAKAGEVVGVSLVAKTTVITAFLLFGGIGSLLVPRILPHLHLLIALLPVVNVLVQSLLPNAITPIMSLPSQLFTLALFILPLALVNGMVFPGTLLLARRLEPEVDAPWGYAADVAGAVLGVFLAVGLPITYGYSATLRWFPFVALVPAALLYGLDIGKTGRDRLPTTR